MGSFLSIIIICAISRISSSTSIQLFSEEGIIDGIYRLGLGGVLEVCGECYNIG